ncbi:MAG: YkgJ family cysteine cluster protein [Candidatus Hydrothermarchaeales archaeon]
MPKKKKPKFVFECQRTGRCCEVRQNIEVFIQDIERWWKDGTYTKVISELDITTLPNGMPMGLSIKKKDVKGKTICPFLEGVDCSIYATRPISCIAYPLGFNGENYILLDKECPGLNKGTMKKERLVEMGGAARGVHESRTRMISVLPILQAVVVKRMVEESEKVMEKLSDEEKEGIKKMLHKTEEKEEEKKVEKKVTKKKRPKRKKRGKGKK